MANHCYNFATFVGKEEDVKKLNNRLTKLRDQAHKKEIEETGKPLPSWETALWVHWESAPKLLFQQVKPMSNHFDVYKLYGSKWFECNWEYSEKSDYIILQGDSAWSPMLPLFQKICKKYNLTCEGNYEEPGMDFAGEFEITSQGDITDIQMSYGEFMQKNNPESYWDQVLCYIDDGVYECLDDIIQEFNPDIWKLTEAEKEELEDAFRKYEQNRPPQTN